MGKGAEAERPAPPSGEGVDDSVDASARDALVEALTTSLRRMLREGDHEGAEVVMRALQDVVRLGGGDRTDVSEKMTRLEDVRRNKRDG